MWLIESIEPDEAVTMVVTLSDFFREILSKGKEFISIKEEEKHISSYLQIQEMRYRDILEYDIQLDQVIYKYQNLKLTLQPVVENALYHGIKYKRAKGCIHIHGEKEGDIISLDTGVIYKGYQSDAARTHAVGEISPEDQKLIDVTKQSIFEGMKMAKAGNHLYDISKAIQDYAESNGFSVVREMVGHGIGKEMHEEPQIPNF